MVQGMKCHWLPGSLILKLAARCPRGWSPRIDLKLEFGIPDRGGKGTEKAFIANEKQVRKVHMKLTLKGFSVLDFAARKESSIKL